jgi:hypothetical protein
MEQPANKKKTRILLIYAVTIIFWFDGRMAFFHFHIMAKVHVTALKAHLNI